MSREITLGITDCGKYENYRAWFANQPLVNVVKLSYHLDNLAGADHCDGIVLSGGEDVHPRFYGKPDFLERCQDIDERRDEFEWEVLKMVDAKGLPLLGICRGLQMANVYLGGTLLPHIPDYGKQDHSRLPADDRYHSLTVARGSLLEKIGGTLSGEVNSAHHQAADVPGRGLVVSAWAPDGVVEALERTDRTLPFLLLVQWHPERMRDQNNVFSRNVRQTFLEAVRAHT